jgi:hypothetical protein
VEITGNTVVEYTEFEVVWGREAESPAPGGGYEVGPFSVKGKVAPGGSLIEAMVRAHQDLSTVAKMVKTDKKAGFNG